MNNPFDNVPSSADVQETTDKKALSSLLSLVERFEIAASREEAAAKNQEELAGAVFEIFLDDDGSMKDFSHSVEIKSMLRQTERNMDAALERVENLVKDIPTTIEDRNRLDKNSQSWKDLLRLYFPIIIGAVAFVVPCLIGGIMLSVVCLPTLLCVIDKHTRFGCFNILYQVQLHSKGNTSAQAFSICRCSVSTFDDSECSSRYNNRRNKETFLNSLNYVIYLVRLNFPVCLKKMKAVYYISVLLCNHVSRFDW